VAISILPVLSALSNRHFPWASAGAVGISGSTMLGIFSDTYINIYIFGCCVSDASCSRHKLLKVENCWRCIRLGGGKYECVWSQTHDFPFSVVPAFIFYWFLLSLPHTKCSSTTSSTIPIRILPNQINIRLMRVLLSFYYEHLFAVGCSIYQLILMLLWGKLVLLVTVIN